jgi:phosphoglycerate dehydrogenase-like enzyme
MAIHWDGTGRSIVADPIIVAPAIVRPLLEPQLPAGVTMRWFTSPDEAIAMAPEADAMWVDQFSLNDAHAAARAAGKARWFNTILAGLSNIPVDFAREHGILVTNGRGLTSDNVATYAVMGVLNLANSFDRIVRAHDRGEWLAGPPPMVEVMGTRALIIGMGTIGERIAARLSAFGVSVTGVRRTPDPASGCLGPDDWRARLGEFDWIVLAAPGTEETRHLIGAAELAAMKQGAALVNVGRGETVDQDALVAALASGRLSGAMLDVTDPEPLPAGHPLWSAPNCIVSMHMAGRNLGGMFRRGSARFARNLSAWLSDDPLEAVVDLSRGY